MDADLLKTLLDYVSDGVCLLDRDHRIVYWNHGAEKITGYLAQEVAGKLSSQQLGLAHDFKCSLSQLSRDDNSRECVEYIRHHHGHRIPVRMGIHPVADAEGEISGIVGVFSRASAQGRTELARAARHSGHDALIGAVNREYGEMRLLQELVVSQRFGLSTAWMRVDIDHSGALERNFGRGMLDAAMRMVAHTIDANLSSLDCLTRWDGHSFRVMIRHAVESGMQELADRLAMLVETSRIVWWGEVREVCISVRHVIAAPDDSLESLETKVNHKCSES